MNRINIICLGVKDMEKAIRFYRDGLGFQTKEKSNTPDVIFFSTSGTKLELYPLDLLAKDINKDNIHEILQKEVGIVFTHVLEDAGVYKCTPEGREAFMRFIESL